MYTHLQVETINALPKELLAQLDDLVVDLDKAEVNGVAMMQAYSKFWLWVLGHSRSYGPWRCTKRASTIHYESHSPN
jgi:hypothetical protein